MVGDNGAEPVTLGEVHRRLTELSTRNDKAFADLGRKIDRLNYVPTEVWLSEKSAITASIAANRAYVDSEIKVVDEKVANVAKSFMDWRQSFARIVGWSLSAVTVLGGGAFSLVAVFHR